MILLDGGSGSGLSIIKPGKLLIKNRFNKEASVQAVFTISKFGYISKSINTTIEGGENLSTSLITIHHNATLIDLHNDILEVMLGEPSYHLGVLHSTHHTDIPRMKKGGVDVQFFSDWVSPSQFSDTLYFDKSLDMINILNSEIAANSEEIGLARNPQVAIALNNSGKIAAVIGVEGGHAIENNLDNLVKLYKQGMRYMTITWNNSTSWAVSAQDARSTTVGLSDFGRSVIRLMDSLGVIIDISHTGIKTIQDILEVTKNPIVATHSGVRAKKNHYRNLYDDQIIAIANSGGVIGVVFYPPFLTNGTAYIDDVIEHIDYINNLVGIDYVAIGSDFDGIEVTPVGLEDISKFPALTLKLLANGYSQQDIEKILGGNFMRVFEQVCDSTKLMVNK
jgi:membrane dipeptidase